MAYFRALEQDGLWEEKTFSSLAEALKRFQPNESGVIREREKKSTQCIRSHFVEAGKITVCRDHYSEALGIIRRLNTLEVADSEGFELLKQTAKRFMLRQYAAEGRG